MGKPKDSSKNRKWEQVRRERLNQTFSDLCKELPCQANSGALSKKAILVEAVSYIQKLQKEKKDLQESHYEQQCSCQNDVSSNVAVAELRAHIRILLQRQKQLVALLCNAGISVPADPDAEHISSEWAGAATQDTSVLDKKASSLAVAPTQSNKEVHRSVLAEKTKPVRKNKDENQKKKQTPLVLQGLRPQLVLTPGAAQAVPVIVSMAGVKTINPVILVQSKPLVPCHTSTSMSVRPIRPTPAVKPSGVRAKVPIPALASARSCRSVKRIIVKAKAKSVTKKSKQTMRDEVAKPSSANGSEVGNPSAKTAGLEKTVLPGNACGNKPVPDNGESGTQVNQNEVPSYSGNHSSESVWIPDSGECTGVDEKAGKRKDESSAPVGKRRKIDGKICENQQGDLKLTDYLSSDSAPNNCVSSVPSPSKSASKSDNYSISALCSLEEEQQQQHNYNQPQSGSSADTVLAKPSCAVSKVKELYVPSNEQYLEWVEKSGSRARSETRTYHSYNTFPGTSVHTSRNTFMPISDSEVFDASENAFGLSLNAPDISSDLFSSLQVPNAGQPSESISPTAAFLLAFPLVSTSKNTELLQDETVCDNTDSQSGMKTILQIGNLDSDSSLNKCNNNIFSVPEMGLGNFGLTPILGQNSSSHKDVQGTRNMTDPKTAPAEMSKESTENVFVFKETSAIHQKGAENASLNQFGDKDGLFITKSAQIEPSSSAMLSNKAAVQAAGGPVSSGMQLTAATQLESSSTSSKQVSVSFSLAPALTEQKSGKERKDDRCSSWPTSTSVCTSNPQIPTCHNSFGDFVVSSPLRQDCALNFPALPSSIMPLNSCSSSTQPYSGCDINFKTQYSPSNVATSISVAQTSSNIGIMSWSTLPSSETFSPTRNGSKLARFHDIFSHKGIDKPGNSQPAYTMASCYGSSMLPVDSRRPETQTSYTNVTAASVSNFVQETTPCSNVDIRPKTTVTFSTGNMSRMPHLVHSHFGRDGKTCEGKKQFPASSSSGSKLTNVPSAGIPTKQLCPQGNLPDPKFIGTSNVGLLPAEKQASITELSCANINYSQSKGSSMQSIVPHSKSQVSARFSNNSGIVVEGKKHSSNNHFHPSTGAKERSDGQYVANNGSDSNINMGNISQCIQNESNNVAVHKETFKPTDQLHHHVHKSVHSIDEDPKTAQKHYQLGSMNGVVHQVAHQQMHHASEAATVPFVRPAKTTSSVHRPPVNWMTAPDVRSSLQNNSSFANNQTSFYLSDHQKDADISVPGPVFDTSNAFHCLDLPHFSGQNIFKGSDMQLFGSEQLENINDANAWSPSKSGSNSVLNTMLIPSTLPTLVGDLALGDSSAISRPFLPTFTADSSPSSKKTSKRALSSKQPDRVEEGQVVQGAEFSSNFLSVSQLVDTCGSRNKNRSTSSCANRTIQPSNHGEMKDVFPVSFVDQDVPHCHQKQSSSKCPSNSYSAEALLSNSLANSNQMHKKKRFSSSVPSHNITHYIPNGSTVPELDNGLGTFLTAAPSSQSQCAMLPDLSMSRPIEFQGSQHNPPYMLPSNSCNVTSAHRNSVAEDETHSRRAVPVGCPDITHVTSSMTANGNSSSDVGMGYEPNFPSFLPPVSVAIPHHPYAQETLYSAPRFQVHTNVNNNNSIQSPSANILTNFHLSTIFPEINSKVIC